MKSSLSLFKSFCRKRAPAAVKKPPTGTRVASCSYFKFEEREKIEMQKQILITGGAGFIGSHLAQKLLRAGHKVRVLDNFSAQVHGDDYDPSRHFTLNPQYEVMHGDVRSPLDIELALKSVDAVYHFAAAVGVGQSMYEVKNYVDTNNLGTANLLQALLNRSLAGHPIQKLIVASSMSLYGEGLYKTPDGNIHHSVKRSFKQLKEKDWEPKSENGETLIPLPTSEMKQPDFASIYALSKYDQERMCLIVGQAYKIPTVALRFFNVYGPGQALSNPYTGVMAIFASRLLNDKSPIIFEDGNQKRDFVHVSDITDACLSALQIPEAAGHVFNIGSGKSYTVTEIALRMAKALNKSQIAPEITQQYRVGDIRHCFADISLAKSILKFQPKIQLEDGLQELATWLSGQRAIDRTRQAREELAIRGLAG